MTRLPPEILDMIFGNVLEEEYIVHYDDDDGQLQYDRAITTSLFTKLACPGFDAFPILPAKYTITPRGNDHLTSAGRHQLHLKLISPLFKADNVGQPFHESISHFLHHNRASLEVMAHARLDEVLKTVVLPRGMRLHYHQKDCSEWQTITKTLSKTLQCHIRPHTTVELALHMKPASCASFLKDIAPMLFKLKDQGININVIHALNVRGPFSNRMKAHLYIREHDLTWLFRGRLQDFEQDIKIDGRTRNTLVRDLCQGKG
jgi:hypothetical protein